MMTALLPTVTSVSYLLSEENKRKVAGGGGVVRGEKREKYSWWHKVFYICSIFVLNETRASSIKTLTAVFSFIRKPASNITHTIWYTAHMRKGKLVSYYTTQRRERERARRGGGGGGG